GSVEQLETRLSPRPSDAWTTDLDAVPPGVRHERLRRVETHRLSPDERGEERGGVVQPQPAARVDQKGEADRMALGESEIGERLDLVVNLVGEVARYPVGRHAGVQLV